MHRLSSNADGQVNLWVASHYLGIPSEVWILRQIERFRSCCPTVLYWEKRSESWCQTEHLDSVHVPFPAWQSEGSDRWLRRLHQMRSFSFYGTYGQEKRFLRELAVRRYPSVVLAHFGTMGLRLLPVLRELGIPMVVHFHGYDLSSLLRNRWYRWSIRANLRHFRAAVVVGSHQRNLLREFGMPEDRIHLIPCGVPTEEHRPAPESHATRPVRFITVSRLADTKGVRESVLAFGEMLAGWSDAELTVIGDGENRRSVEQLVAEPRFQDKVKVLGWVPPEVKRSLMEQADVFLQHSLTGSDGWVEGFGVSIAEAAATGLPVVVTRAGGIVDQVVDGETGFIVEQHDVTGMSRAMLKLAREPELRQRMGRAGRERMVNFYDTANQVAKLEDVLIRAATCERVRQRTSRDST